MKKTAFAGKIIIRVKIGQCVSHASDVITKCVAAVEVTEQITLVGFYEKNNGRYKESSYDRAFPFALPVIIAGSLMVAVAKIIGLAIGESNLDAFAHSDGLTNWLYLTQDIGFKIIGLMNYVLGAYVAYSVAGKKGLAAGFTAGFIRLADRFSFLERLSVACWQVIGVGLTQNPD